MNPLDAIKNAAQAAGETLQGAAEAAKDGAGNLVDQAKDLMGGGTPTEADAQAVVETAEATTETTGS